MSRYCAEHDSGKVFEAAAHWRRNALEADGSAFGNKSLWQLPNLEALDQHFVKNYDAGEGNFLTKFEKQLAPTEPGVKQLAAEILWVMFLCPSNITPDTKRENIATIWNWSGETLPDNLSWLKDEYLGGVGSAGTGYNTNRFRELAYVIRVMTAFKKLSEAERQRLLSDGWALAEWLEEIPENEARQFRHMLLFLLFPDEFERVFGGSDRVRIVSGFTGKSNSQVKGMSAREIDRELLDIRRKQEETYGQQELDFYEPPLRELWGESRNVSWLLSWNPNYWTWETFGRDREATHDGKTVTERWSCSSKQPKVGDKAYLLRTGMPPKGIIAAGNIVTEPYEAPDWDEEKAAQGKTRWYVDVAFSRIQDPFKDPYVSEDDLAQISVDHQVWSPQSSGIEIKSRSAGVLKKLWDKVIEATPEPKGEVKSLEIAEPVNLIYFGPPGTGKTYTLSKLFEKYTSQKQHVDRQAWLVQQLLDARWFDAIFAALVDLGERAKVAQIAEHEFISLKALAMGRNRHIRHTVWAILQEHARENSATVHYKKRNPPLVFDKEGDGTWALVDDWREEGEEQVAMAKSWRQGPQAEAVQQRYEMVTFHQAYSYEDFVEGIRPGQDEETGELVYRVVPGVFRRICQKAKADPQQRYAIFIDEINRGNIAKIFGELITLIEDDKRVAYNHDGSLANDGMELTLPYSGDRFGVPKNLDVYGAMNTADRSIALLDTALRRRFKFEELMPQAGLINGSRGDGYIEDGEGGIINLRALLEAMNRRIRFLLNRDMTLGHSYLMKVKNFTSLREVMLHKIIPLLQEYFYEDWHRIQLIFRDVDQSGNALEPQIISHSTMNEEEVLGFDHDDYENIVEYRVEKDNITPTAIRKIYEKSA